MKKKSMLLEKYKTSPFCDAETLIITELTKDKKVR